MFTITDLHQNEELSESSMSKVAGGATCEQAVSDANQAAAWDSIWYAAGAIDDLEYHDAMNYRRGYVEGACGVTPTN